MSPGLQKIPSTCSLITISFFIFIMIFHFSTLTSTWLWWLWLFTKAVNFLDMAVWLWQLGLICHFHIQCITIYYISFCVFFHIILITILFIILGVASSSSLVVLSSPHQHCDLNWWFFTHCENSPWLLQKSLIYFILILRRPGKNCKCCPCHSKLKGYYESYFQLLEMWPVSQMPHNVFVFVFLFIGSCLWSDLICPKPSWQRVQTPQKLANAPLNLDNSSLNKGIGDAGSTADFRMLWSAMVCLGLL